MLVDLKLLQLLQVYPKRLLQWNDHASADWRETEVAHNRKKHGVILCESDLSSGHPLV